ncbi:MAG: START domain-containing protein [Nevskiales bacterium]|nr:START domain-containing protein [Nevskiales bacterium]
MKSNSATGSDPATATRRRARLIAGYLAAGLLSAPFRLWGAESADTWHLDRQEDGIAVYSRAVEGSQVRAIRAEADIAAAFGDTVALLLDAPMRPAWDEICAEATVVRRVSDREDLIYVHNDLPWPVSDRDMLLRRHWSIAADGSRAQIRAAAAEDGPPPMAGRVPVRQADGVWTVQRTGVASVHLSTVVHAEPGGPIPAWLTNALSVQGPYNALRNIRHLLESGAYPPAGLDPGGERLHPIGGPQARIVP